jgi:ABC-2 type transport system permease protein
MLALLPLQLLSGSVTPRESMPFLVRDLMLLAPNTHFVMLAQAILYRGAGFSIVWPQFAALAVIAGGLFGAAWLRFRRTLSSMT